MSNAYRLIVLCAGLLCLFGVFLSMLVMSALAGAEGAPQQGAVGALASALVVIPYVFLRTLQICTLAIINPPSVTVTTKEHP